MSEQQRVDFDAIMKRVEEELRKPGGLLEQFADADACQDQRVSALQCEIDELRERVSKIEGVKLFQELTVTCLKDGNGQDVIADGKVRSDLIRP